MDKDMLIAQTSLALIFQQLRVSAIEVVRNDMCAKCKEFDSCGKPCKEAWYAVKMLVGEYFHNMARSN